MFKKNNKINVGRRFTEEHKRKISESNKGKNLNKKSYWKGKKLTYPIWNKGLKIREVGRDKTKGSGKGKKNISHIEWSKANHIHRVPTGAIIHHIDGNQFNNHTSNLQLMTKDFHSKLHREYEKQRRLK